MTKKEFVQDWCEMHNFTEGGFHLLFAVIPEKDLPGHEWRVISKPSYRHTMRVPVRFLLDIAKSLLHQHVEQKWKYVTRGGTALDVIR